MHWLTEHPDLTGAQVYNWLEERLNFKGEINAERFARAFLGLPQVNVMEEDKNKEKDKNEGS
ncbi:hypothetical protein [Mesobacillus zeae]|uniref:hypothetical protein n=1 Tax=Mesobacillus zeae TaxID=1917180 RepID=UPI0015E6FC72|nr:hypothetical protein [Mesobacillus zeae]